MVKINELKPMVVRAVTALYGQAIRNIKIQKVDQFPLFLKIKEGWRVNVEFGDDKYQYSVQMDVQMADGRITRSIEMRREPLE